MLAQPVMVTGRMTPCTSCGAEDSVSRGSKVGWPLWECGRCGALFTDANSRASEIEARYEGAYAETESVPQVVLDSLDRLVRRCEPFRRSGRWLDVGYGQGDLLGAAARQKWTCYGTELALPALALGEGRGWIVSVDGERDARFPAGGFDVVSMVELIEHVVSPRPFLAAAFRWLRPGGLLYVTTPNVSSLNYRILGIEWSVVVPPEHLNLWTGRGLGWALRDAGFEPVTIRTEGLNPFEILGRLRRRRGEVCAGYHRNRAVQGLATTLERHSLGRAARAAVNHFVRAFGVGDTLKAWAIRP